MINFETGKQIKTTKNISLLDDFSFSSAYNNAIDEFKWSPVTFSGRTNFLNKKISFTFSGSLDPYAIDENGNRINQFNWEKNKKAFRFTSGAAAFSMDFQNTFGNKKSDIGTEDELEDINKNIANYIDFSVPWNLSLDYTLNYSNSNLEKDVTQSIRFNGDISLTKKWKIAFSSGYDFTNKEITYTTIDIYRDLHCWEMSFNWVPFGYQQSYFFNLKVKAPILQDLKLTKRRLLWLLFMRSLCDHYALRTIEIYEMKKSFIFVAENLWRNFLIANYTFFMPFSQKMQKRKIKLVKKIFLNS